MNLYAEDSYKPTVVEGSLILHQELNSSIPLDGKWKFYWKQFKEDITENSKFIYIPVPSSWMGFPIENDKEKIPAHGYGTYTLQITLDKNIDSSSIGIRLMDFGSSYRAFVNGKLIASNGRVGKTNEEYEFDMNPLIAKFPISSNNEFFLEIEVANFDNTNGGFWNRAYIGNLGHLYDDRSLNTSINYFFFGITTIMGIYSLLYFFYVKNYKSSFYFGVFSILLGLWITLTGERVFSQLFPAIPFSIIYKAEYLTMYLTLPFFVEYAANLIPELIPNIALKVVRFIVLMCSVVVLFFSANVYSHTVAIVQPLIIIYGFALSYYLFKAIHRRTQDAMFVLTSLIVLLFAAINDILFHETIWKSIILVPYALILFIFLHGMLLGKRFASSYIHSKFLANELMNVNSGLEEKIQIRTKDLESKMQSISKDLIMAKNIQDRILGVKSIKNEHFEFQAIYEPIEKLGGDFFDIFEISKNLYRIMVADATGHGIQAALITMAIKSEYEFAKFHFANPNEIVQFLNQQFCTKYKNLKIFFSCIILDFDCINGNLIISSAGHPNPILIRNSNLVEQMESHGSIIGLSKKSIYKTFQNRIHSKDTIFLFTDGWTEQFNKEGEMYGEKKFLDSILKHNSKDLGITLNQIQHDTYAFLSDCSIQDDLALLAIHKK